MPRYSLMCLRHYCFDRTFVDTLIGINPTYYVQTHSEDLKLGFTPRLWSVPMTLPLSEWAQKESIEFFKNY